MISTIISFLPYLAAILCAVIFVFFYRSGLKKYAKQLLLCFVSSAEQSYGAGTGKLKYSAVASKLYEVMPKPFKFIFSEKSISAMIETAVFEMKKYLGAPDTPKKEEAEND